MSGELHVHVHDCAAWTSSDEFCSWEPSCTDLHVGSFVKA